HCHLELSYFKGVMPQGLGLVEFVRQVITHRNDYTTVQKIEALRAEQRLMWLSGTQAVGDISNDPFSFETKKESPISYYTFSEYFGTPSKEKALDEFSRQTADNFAMASALGIPISHTPHSTYLVSDALFRMACNSSRASIHFMETLSEVDFFEARGGMYDFMVGGGMQVDFLNYGSHSRRLVESLPAELPLLLVHNTQIQRSDVELIMSHFHDVTFVLCPRSNYYIERGFPPAQMLYQMGARVALGTDSLSSNTSLLMASEVEWLARHNPDLPLEVILSWATRGGAQALAMPLGQVEIGSNNGLVLFEGVDFRTMRPLEAFSCRRLI
ncbi:MAG: amidohydrolase family protein, partial [Mucinivorans sp.]